MLSKGEVHQIWTTARHDAYKEGQERSHFMADVIDEYVESAYRGNEDDTAEIALKLARSKVRVLELGCNIGRNMAELESRGYKHLFGVDINEWCGPIMEQHYPALNQTAFFYWESIEDFSTRTPYKDQIFDVIFTMATLEHLHPDVLHCLCDIACMLAPGGRLITLEDEYNLAGLNYVFGRDYGALFEACGLNQVAESDCLPTVVNLKEGYVLREFNQRLPG